MKTPSVLMFSPQFRPIVGGAERQAEKLAKALVRQGARVRVLTPQIAPDTPRYEEDTGVAINRFPLFDLCRRFPGVRGLGTLNLLLIRSQVLRAMSRHLDGVDMVHTHIASPLTAFAMDAAKRRGIPVLCKAASAGPPNDLQRIDEVGALGPFIRTRIQAGMDSWIATTGAVEDSLAASGIPRERIAGIPNGVDLLFDHADTLKPSVAVKFLYLGRLSANTFRDTPTLIRAFDHLADDHPLIELALVGEGDLYPETAGLVARCRHPDRIRMPGLADPDPWVRWADCFVLPSRREGLSNALLEAMAAGLSCIANDIPPNREVLASGAAGVLVPVGDEGALYQALRRMTNDPTYVGTMRAAALHRVREVYGIDAVAKQYLDLYDQLLRRSIL